MQLKKDILWRVYLVYGIMALLSLAIIYKVVKIQYVEGKKWADKSRVLTSKNITVDAIRGNIYDCSGNLLSTSIPFYDVAMDMTVSTLDTCFEEKVDSLSGCLSRMFIDKSKERFKRELKIARKDKRKFYLLHKGTISFNQLQRMKKFPIFRYGRYKGGLIYTQENKRLMPFKFLAARTIGYVRKDAKPIGLEGTYDKDLSGVGGIRLMQRISGNDWKPISSENQLEPQDGNDIITTLDINIQDVAENALYNQLVKQNADHGCVVLMEVKTGEIRAIANLKRAGDGVYQELFNHAIAEASEPGSTFKLASLMTAIEDGYADIKDTVNITGGVTQFYGREMKDSHEGISKLSLMDVFAHSSNVGTAKTIVRYYSKEPQKFIDGLYRLKLNEKLGVEVAGEAQPEIKNTKDKYWSGMSLPWMSIGYELKITPLQTLTLYNAVANDGVRVRPMLVKEIRNRGMIVKSFDPKVDGERICSKETVAKMKKMLEAVVDHGTAKNLKAMAYTVAGKTGTAQIAKKGGYKENGVTYQGSFVGYFPADRPQYSCIVIVNAPSNGVYYGNVVAGAVFKEIADRVYATSLFMHQELKPDSGLIATPIVKGGYKPDFFNVRKMLGLATDTTESKTPWMLASIKENLVHLQDYTVSEKGVPNVVGLNLQDAINILEMRGYKVHVNGRGAVKSQSVGVGSFKEPLVYLELG